MKQVKNLIELLGRTVLKAIPHGDDIVVLFSDQSVAVFVVYYDDDGHRVQIDDNPISDGVQVTLGMISQSEYIAREKQRREAETASLKENRRKEYEMLKREFENQ